MNRKSYIILLMFLSWPVNIIHRAWNNSPAFYMEPFLFDSERIELQTYIYGLLGLLSWLMIFWAIWLYITGNYKHDRDFKLVFSANFINLCIDVPHYLLAYQRSEFIIFVQGMIILVAAAIYFKRKIKTKR